MDSDDEMSDVNTDSNLNISSQTTFDTPSSSTNHPIQDQDFQPAPQTTNFSPPPTLLLDSIVFKEVCENIFEDMNKMVKSRNDPIHTDNYEQKWNALRERVDRVMRALQKLSIEAMNQSLNNWSKEVVNNMKEVEVNKDNSTLYISDSPFFLDASVIITSGVQDNLDLSWLTKLTMQDDISILEKLKRDSE